MTGDYVKPSLGRITVSELAPDWLARKREATKPMKMDAAQQKRLLRLYQQGSLSSS